MRGDRRSAIRSLGTACLIVGCAWNALQAQPDARYAPRTAAAGGLRQPARRTAASFSVMGEIAKPGVYLFETPRIRLTDLVRDAGGLTRQANGNIRIVRDGRAGQQTFFSEESDCELLAGDIVIIDPRTTPPRPTGRRPAGAESPLVQVALLNVGPHPVLVTLPPERATLDGVMTLVHAQQNSRQAQPLRVLPPRGGVITPQQEQAIQLMSGSVVVIDPDSVDDRLAGELGAAPRPLGDAAVDSRPAHRVQPAPAPVVEERPQILFAPSAGGVSADNVLAGTPTASAPESAAAPPPSTEVALLPPGEASNPAAAPPVVEEVAGPTEQPVPLPPEETLASPPRELDIATLPQRLPSTRTPAADIEDPFDSELEESVPPPPRTNTPAARTVRSPATPQNSVGSILGIGIGVFLIATVLLSRVGREDSSAPRRPPQADPLDALIHNRLLVWEEPLAWSRPLQFHGRPQDGTLNRLDPAPAAEPAASRGHGLAGPHFRMRPAARTEPVAEAEPAAATDVAREARPAPENETNAPPAPRSGTGRRSDLLDRVLSAVKEQQS